MERQKTTKHGPACRTLDWQFIPFVIDTFGGFGEQAHAVLSTLAKTRRDSAPHRDRREVEAALWQEMSFCVIKELGRQLSWSIYVPPRGEDGIPLLPPLTSAFW